MTKRRNRIYRRIAAALIVALLAVQGHAFVFAEESMGDTQQQTESVSEENGTEGADNGDANDGNAENNCDDTERNGGEDDQNPEEGNILEDDGETVDQQKEGDENTGGGATSPEAAEIPVVLENEPTEDEGIAALDLGTSITYKGIRYQVNMGELWVDSYQEADKAVGDVIIPGVIDGCRVTGIGTQAFYYCGELTNITLPESVEWIREGAFEGCSSLKSIEIPEGVTRIGNGAFCRCSSLTSIKLPERLTNIEEHVFSECSSLSSIELPEGVTSIGELAFGGCSSLGSIEIPEGVTSIEGGVFAGCSSLRSIEIPEGVTSIEASAFSGCSSLGSIEIPKKVTRIQRNSFKDCSNLTSVTISENITNIYNDAFFHCDRLQELRIVVRPDGTYQFPEVESRSFTYLPDERYLLFVDENGEEVTGQAYNDVFAEAAKNDSDPDDNPDDGKWYGWSYKRLPETVHTYTVTIYVKKDGEPWESHGRTFALLKDSGDFLTVSGQPAGSTYELSQVPDGAYRIYDTTSVQTGARNSRARDTGMEVRVSGTDTEVDVMVNGADKEETVPYYTVTFYDGKEAYGTPQQPQVVLNGQKVVKPEDPEKAGWQFAGWKTADGGSTPYEFNDAVVGTTAIYASWVEKTAEQLHITATATEGGTIAPEGDIAVTRGGEQTFTITPETGKWIKAVTVDGTDVTGQLGDTPARAQAGAKYYTFTNVIEDHAIHAEFESDGSIPGDGDIQNPGGRSGDYVDTDSGSGTGNIQMTVVSELAAASAEAGGTGDMVMTEVTAQTTNDSEPKTGDAAHMEVYATIAMIAGLTYLLLYFMEKGRGMTEREKDVFVAAFIRWGKKGGAFRKGCAVIVVFCLLVYYHATRKFMAGSVDEKDKVFLSFSGYPW